MTAAVLLAALAAAPAPGEWAVIGLKDPGAEPVGPLVSLARGALAVELGPAGRILGPEETRARLGLPPPDLDAVRERLDAAELYYFQLELSAARRSVAGAIDALVRAGGTPEAWEWLRLARLLLASIELAPGTPASRERARDALLPLARVRPGERPSESAYPAEVLAAFDEAVRSAAAAPRGTLRVRCRRSCPAAHVWIDGASADDAAVPVSLPAGAYHVVVTDSFDRPRLRSLAREVEVKAGAEATVEVDLEEEGALDAADGPSLLAPAEARTGALVLAARRQVAEHLAAVWSTGAGDERRLHLAVVRPEGRIERQAQIRVGTAGEAAGLERLVHFAVSGELAPGVEDATLPEAVRAPVPEMPAPSPAPAWKTWAKWSSAAAAVALAATGTWFAWDAERRDDRLQDRVAGWGGSVPVEHRGPVLAEREAIGGRRDLALGLLVGAGVAGAGAAVFFLFDDDRESTR
jgi:hypothetical protein